MLVREHRALQEEQGEDDTLARAAADCEQVLARASRWPVQDRGWDSLEAGMGKVVRDGRHRMTKACVKARAEDFHEWRKQVKYLRHQLDLLRPAWPDGQRGAIALGRRLYAEKPSSLTNRLGRLWTVAA